MFNIHMSGTCHWFLCHGHSDACVVILVQDRNGMLWDAEVPEDASNVEPNFAKSDAPINSASVEDCATVSCSFVLYAIVPPAKCRHTPVREWHVLGQVAQSELTYP